jgi:hypothetical protein
MIDNDDLRDMRDAARDSVCAGMNSRWRLAYQRLEDAADRLLLMMERCTVDEKTESEQAD